MNFGLAISVFLLSSFWGLYKTYKLHKRNLCLEQLSLMFEKMIIYIQYENMKTIDIIKNLSESSELSELVFLDLCEKNLLLQQSFSHSWNDAIAKSKDKLPLEEKDYSALGYIANSFGAVDSDAQISALKLSQDICKKLSSSSLKKTEEKSKLYSSMGVLCGMLLAILVL